jgi:hypothetical protein
MNTQTQEALEQLTNLTRLEVIDNNGRAYVNMAIDKLEFSYQDEGRTLKIFTNGAGELKPAQDHIEDKLHMVQKYKKEWQGLTANELEDIKDNSKEGWYQLVRNVEQALKEKNT